MKSFENNNLEKLEYNLILEKLSLFCKTYLGKNFCMNLKPSSNKVEVKKLLNQTEEAFNFIIRKGNLPIYEISDISLYLKKLESNTSLSAKALLEIANILKLSRELKEYFKSDDIETDEFTVLSAYFNNLYSNPDLEKSILSAIIDENNIADNASAKLSSIRKEKRKLEAQIKDSLNKTIHSSTYSNAIMEQIITIKNDRYVIPVKEEYRSKIKGFIHDISASGSTVFIEPMQVFELNNNLQTFKIEENIEIEHILESLSFKIVPYLAELKNNLSLITLLDFIFAKASFAKDINATCPYINENKIINLIQARHPLIDKSQVIPIDIKIGDEYSSLIITGPNTGGKTVTLKTVGLLTAMACSGLFIPTKENSSIYVFDNIFADIGDEQSIEQSLSTFSSHIVNIINIIKNSTSDSLILLDELGSGTDPIEGSALAISILDYFNKQSSITIATTHYNEVKNYALVTNGFENASSGFDLETLTPTYKLLIGVPGKSNAFEISKRLGLSENILDNAKSLLKQDDINIEELLKNIYDDKLIVENTKNEIEKNKTQIENLRKSLEQEIINQKEEKNIKFEKAKQESQNMLISAKEQINNTINELNDLYDNFKDLENIDFVNWSDTEIANFVKKHFKKGILTEANSIRKKYNDSFNNFKSDNEDKINSSKEIDKNELKIGSKIKLYNFSDIGTIISLPNKSGKIQVQFSNSKMYTNISDIERIVTEDINNSVNSYSKSSKHSNLKSKQITSEINVIGQNVEEACFIIDKYLDDCSLSKLSTVRIIHGKGTRKIKRRNS